MQGVVLVLAQEFASKYRSKRECFNFLAGEVRAYLSGYENHSIYHLKALIDGSKKCKDSKLDNGHVQTLNRTM